MGYRTAFLVVVHRSLRHALASTREIHFGKHNMVAVVFCGNQWHDTQLAVTKFQLRLCFDHG